MSLIDIQSVTKSYKSAHGAAVCNASFGVNRGEILALLGPSGSGKTTLLRLIAGLETPDQGTILLEGVVMNRPGYDVPPESRKVGMVFQDGALFPHLTVEKNIAFGLSQYNKTEQHKKVMDMLRLVSLESFAKLYPHELSGGQQQRVALARALAPNPVILLMDEPFSSLDPDMRETVRNEVDAILKRIGITAILVTHDHEEAFAMADKVAVLNAGRIEQIDTPENIYHLPATPFVANFVGSADFIRGEMIEDGKISTEIGIFSNETGKGDRSVAPPIVVMVRPDDIHIMPDPNGKATIDAKQFRGSENLYTVSLPSGAIVHSSEHSLVAYPVGTTVTIALTATHTVVFSASSIKMGVTTAGIVTLLVKEAA